MSKNIVQNKEVFIKKYIELLLIIKSTTFRGPIKKFIDENCNKINNNEESSHDDYIIYMNFIELVNSLLNDIKSQLNITEEEFVKLVKVGLQREKEKYYFEQIIACENYIWFKDCCIVRQAKLMTQSLEMFFESSQDKGFSKEFNISNFHNEKNKVLTNLSLEMSILLNQRKEKLYNNDEDYINSIEHSKLIGRINEEDRINLIDKNNKKLEEINNEYNKKMEEKESVNISNKNRKNIKFYDNLEENKLINDKLSNHENKQNLNLNLKSKAKSLNSYKENTSKLVLPEINSNKIKRDFNSNKIIKSNSSIKIKENHNLNKELILSSANNSKINFYNQNSDLKLGLKQSNNKIKSNSNFFFKSQFDSNAFENLNLEESDKRFENENEKKEGRLITEQKSKEISNNFQTIINITNEIKDTKEIKNSKPINKKTTDLSLSNIIESIKLTNKIKGYSANQQFNLFLKKNQNNKNEKNESIFFFDESILENEKFFDKNKKNLKKNLSMSSKIIPRNNLNIEYSNMKDNPIKYSNASEEYIIYNQLNEKNNNLNSSSTFNNLKFNKAIEDLSEIDINQSQNLLSSRKIVNFSNFPIKKDKQIKFKKENQQGFSSEKTLTKVGELIVDSNMISNKTLTNVNTNKIKFNDKTIFKSNKSLSNKLKSAKENYHISLSYNFGDLNRMKDKNKSVDKNLNDLSIYDSHYYDHSFIINKMKNINEEYDKLTEEERRYLSIYRRKLLEMKEESRKDISHLVKI